MTRTLTIIILFFFYLPIFAQSAKLFTADKELSSSLINKIYQDRNGMIWIATEDGLNRYDGAKFTIYKNDPNNSYSLSHNYVLTLFEDSKGNLLIGTHNSVQIYDPATDSFSLPARWEDTGELFNSSTLTIFERKNGEIWVSGNNLCVMSFRENNQLVMKKLDLPIPTTLINSIIEDSRENIWVTTGENGVYKMDTHKKTTLYLENEKGMTITDIREDQQGNIYLGTMGRGLFKYDNREDNFFPIKYKGKQDLPIKMLYPISRNEIYIGTDGRGLKILDIKSLEISDYSFNNSYFDSGTSKVHSILNDKAGNLWQAIYQKGVLMIPAQINSFKYIGYKSFDRNTIGSHCITSIHKDHNDIIWVGTDNDGIYGITENGKQHKHFAPTEDINSVPATIMNIYEDSEHNLWFGSYTQGMGKLNRQTGYCNYRNDLIDRHGNSVQRVYDFAEDNNKRLWIATMGAGLFYYDLTDQNIHYNQSLNERSNRWICSLLYSGDNKLYMGTYDGIFCADLNTDEFKTTNRLRGHIIFSMYEDKEGMIWIGSSVGLTCLNPRTEEIVTYTDNDGLPGNSIYAIQGDDLDCLWISTNAGISQFNLKTHKFINYYVSDGLQGNEFSKNASFKEKNGNLWFGGMNGITYFNPREIVSPYKKWNIRITDFYLHDIPVRKGMQSNGKDIIDRPVFDAEHFYLSHKDNAFSIEFSTLELNNPERITYLYAMNSDKWISLPQGSNRVSFNNMEPGVYHFRIKAMDYMLDSDIKQITIHISPAWWASPGAKFTYTVLVLLIIGLIVQQVRSRYRTRQEMVQHVHVEQINEAKLQFFINISHEIRTPMSLIISPLQKLMQNDDDSNRQKIYHTIYRNAERLLHLVNQLIDIRKIDKGQLSLSFREMEIIDFINDICDTFTPQAVKKDITLQLHCDGDNDLKLWIDPVNFDKIFLNILTTVFRFTPEHGKIDIYIRTEKNTDLLNPVSDFVEFIISHNGKPMDEKEIEQIFDRFYPIRNDGSNTNAETGIGLPLTRSLVELHHGTICAKNNPDGQTGFRFIIRMPLGCSHLSPEELDAENMERVDENRLQQVSVVLTPEENTNEAKARSKTNFRVLVVEDDEEIRHYICQELADDFHIIQSSNGKEALATIFKKAPDLVISDVMMPEMDGFTLCRKIKQNVNLNHIPVILLTAKAREEDNIEGLETGADAYIMKPFNIEILGKTVKNLIRNRERLRNIFAGQQIKEEKLQKIEVQSPDDKLLERIMKVINDNLSNPNLTVEMITEEVGISRVHLHRKLKELTNQTTRDFIRNVRLKQAAKLLSEKRHSISEVAELTGFSNPNNFSTAFKELYGMSPKVYMDEQLGKK